MALITMWLVVMLLAMSLSGLLGCVPSMYGSEVGREELPYRSAVLSGTPELAGLVPVAEVLSKAQRDKVISSAPLGLIRDHKAVVPCSPLDDWYAIVRKIEFIFNIVYDAKSGAFYAPSATHDVDAPDSAGRAMGDNRLALAAREMVVVRYRFMRAVGSIAIAGTEGTGLEAAGNFIELGGSAPAGVRMNYAHVTTRRYFEGSTSVETGVTVQTAVKNIQAGVTVQSLVGTMPGGLFRMNSQLSVSSFTGQGLDSSDVHTPLEIDAPRGTWHRVTTFKAANAGLRAALKGIGLTLDAGGDTVVVLVKVD